MLLLLYMKEPTLTCITLYGCIAKPKMENASTSNTTYVLWKLLYVRWLSNAEDEEDEEIKLVLRTCIILLCSFVIYFCLYKSFSSFPIDFLCPLKNQDMKTRFSEKKTVEIQDALRESKTLDST